MELISREYVLDCLNAFTDTKHGNRKFLAGIRSAREVVENAPSVLIMPENQEISFLKEMVLLNESQKTLGKTHNGEYLATLENIESQIKKMEDDLFGENPSEQLDELMEMFHESD